MSTKNIRALLERLDAIETKLHNKDFLLTWQQSDADLHAVLLAAEALEEMWRDDICARVFTSGLAVSNFRDKSTRTRFSFASAVSLLGLSCMDLDESKSQLSHGETVRETANMISFLTEVIGIRDDLFIHEGHKYMADVSAAIEEGYREKVLPQRPCVVNLQCDKDHPTQSLSDLLHLQKTFGSLEALRGKKIAMTWGLFAVVRQAAVGGPGDHHADDAVRDERGAGPSGRLRRAAGSGAGCRQACQAVGRIIPEGAQHGRGVPRRGRGLPQELGSIPDHGAADGPASRRSVQEAGRSGERVPGQQREVQGTGSATRS